MIVGRFDEIICSVRDFFPPFSLRMSHFGQCVDRRIGGLLGQLVDTHILGGFLLGGLPDAHRTLDRGGFLGYMGTLDAPACSTSAANSSPRHNIWTPTANATLSGQLGRISP